MKRFFSVTKFLRSLDIFSREPAGLKFGNRRYPKTQGMWKSAFGGFITCVFAIVIFLYLISSFIALDSGQKDTTTTFEFERPYETGTNLTLEEMKVMPVVTLTAVTPHLYLNSSSISFKKNVFVALL